jgi:group II intron reverse transcriptase/maturase
MRTEDLRPYLREHWARIRTEILAGTYQPMPVRRVEIPKPDGGIRLLGIPTCLDRLIQQALSQVLTPIFEPGFSESSFGFRPGRSAKQAINQARAYIQEGYTWVVDMDLAQFFDRVNHDVLMARVARKVQDKRVLRLIRLYLESGVMIGGVKVRTEEGTPQGGPLSPLLANILLDDLDKELEKRGHRFARYADDCNIYVRSKRAGERVMQSVKDFVENRLKLKVNEAKSAVDRPWKRKFLGFSFYKNKGEVRIRLAPKTVKRFKAKIRTLTSRTRSMSMKERIRQLNDYLKGWMGYFGLAQTRSVFTELEEWIRRRLRQVLWKQWKWPATRRRELRRLGLKEQAAREIAGTRKGYWRTAATPQLHQALGIAYWKNQGLVSLVDLFDRKRGA